MTVSCFGRRKRGNVSDEWVIGLTIYGAVNAAAFVAMFAALRHRSELSRGPFMTLVRGSFARRDEFTEKGWRLRSLAVRLHAAAFALLVIALLIW